MRRVLFLCGVVGVLVGARQTWAFRDLYSEAVYLNGVRTIAGLANFRIGQSWREHSEIYGVARAGIDTRTYLERSDAIFNDNFLFLGAGYDYLGLMEGVRLTFKTGFSIDLNPKIHRGGFDLRTGMLTYHEVPSFVDNWFQEIYSESLYVHRYRNFLAALQWRWGGHYGISDWGEWGPLAALAFSVDSHGYDYNRFSEIRLGGRIRLRKWGSLAFWPQYVLGSRWNVENVSRANYHELRLLLTAYASF